MADEDNFDIDIYGDGGAGEDYDDSANAPGAPDASTQDPSTGQEQASGGHDNTNEAVQDQSYQNEHEHQGQAADAADGTVPMQPTQQVQPQGTKRKETQDERALDPGATMALFVTDLPWWVTDDDLRGFSSRPGCEDEVDEVTFSEHKVNGKSKGQAYILFSSPQAATATKRAMETGGEGRQKFASNYTNPMNNPFKTLPKDGNMRNPNQGARSASGGFSAGGQGQVGVNTGGFRGGRGGFNNNNNNRGGVGGYSRGGFNQPMNNMNNNFGAVGMNSFQAGMGGMNQYGGGFQGNRGAMMGGMRGGSIGMRGGRGGMNTMMGMPMGGIMGGMPGQMPNMGMGMPGMGMQGTGFQNGNFFPQQNDSWNPHGAKRTRQE